MRKQIIDSILDKIKDVSEEIIRCDYDIEQCQRKLNALMDDDEVTLENIVAFKVGYKSAQEIEEAILQLDEQISIKRGELETGILDSEKTKRKRS